MKYLVLYTHYPRPRDVRTARTIFGADVALDLVMPVVSPPIDEDAVAPWIADLPDHFVAIVQPPEDEIPSMTFEQALQLVRAHEDEEWMQMRGSWNVDDIHWRSREFPRFWLILAQVRPWGMPPGLGFIVDKYSQRVLCRRFIDVDKCISTGGPAMALR